MQCRSLRLRKRTPSGVNSDLGECWSSLTDRCVVLIDLDCFYAQVEQVRLRIPKEEPLAVSRFPLLQLTD
jgi:hypothetical protein